MLDPKSANLLIGLTGQYDQASLSHFLVDALDQVATGSRHVLLEIIDNGRLLLDPNDRNQPPRPIGAEASIQRCLADKAPVTDGLASDGQTPECVFPILADNEVTAVLVRRGGPATPQIDKITDIFVRVFANLTRVYQHKEQDTLTGLLTRQSFEEKLAQVAQAYSPKVQELRKPGHSACLAILDIDHFKKVNDVFGHVIGDEVLVLFTRLMKEVFRHSDYLFRFGGEEFISVLVEVDLEKARAGLERYRQAVEAYSFPQVGGVTVSIGFVMLEAGEFSTLLLEKADQALYFAKKNGRNQVQSYEILVENGDIAQLEHAADDVDLWE